MNPNIENSFVYPHTRVRLGGLLSAVILAAATSVSSAGDGTNAVSAKAEKPPPLPLHQIEGNGGVFATLSAYLVNPPRDGELVGRPDVGFSYINLGHGQKALDGEIGQPSQIPPWRGAPDEPDGPRQKRQMLGGFVDPFPELGQAHGLTSILV